MLITYLKILADRWQTMLPSLICLELSNAAKERTIPDSLYMVCMSREKVDRNSTLINLYPSNGLYRVDHSFLDDALSVAGLGHHFCSWIRLPYASLGVLVEVNAVWSKLFTLTGSIRQVSHLLPAQYVLALEPFLRRLRTNRSYAASYYSACTDYVSVLVTKNAVVVEGNQKKSTKSWLEPRLTIKKSVVLQLGSWRGYVHSASLIWKDEPNKILGVSFSPDLQLEKN